MKFRIFPVLTCSIAFALACGGGGSTEAPAPPAPPPPAPPVEAPPAAGGGDMIGVQECDDYIKKMGDCLATMDPATKSSMESSFTMMRDGWKQAAATPEGKGALQAGCKAALDSIPPTCNGGGAGGAPPAGDPNMGGTPPAGGAPPAGDAAAPTGDGHKGPPNMPPPGGRAGGNGGNGGAAGGGPGNMPAPRHN